MSHHSSYDPTNPSDPERQKLSEVMKELLGEFPSGKLNARDEGAIAVSVGHENGAVVLKFPKPVAWIGFTPEQAVQIAESLIGHARSCGHSGIITVKL